MEKQKMPDRRKLVEGLTVSEGHFWIDINDVLTPQRRDELKADARKTETLMLVKDRLLARIERPHPTRRQMALLKEGL